VPPCFCFLSSVAMTVQLNRVTCAVPLRFVFFRLPSERARPGAGFMSLDRIPPFQLKALLVFTSFIRRCFPEGISRLLFDGYVHFSFSEQFTSNLFLFPFFYLLREGVSPAILPFTGLPFG